MAVKRIRQAAGLVTDPSALDAPEGALRQADNVMLHRPGIIHPRPGFGDTTGVAARTTDFRPVQFIPFRGEIVVQSIDISTETDWRLEKLSADVNYKSPETGSTAACDPLNSAINPVSGVAEMRSALYVTSATGLRKLESPGATALELAGVATDYHTPSMMSRVATAGTAGAVDATSSVAYRYVWLQNDANDYERRSAPSPRVVIRNTTAAAWHTTFSRLYLPEGILLGDFLEVYRTENSGSSSADPGDECYRALAYEVTTGNVSDGYIDVGDFWDQAGDDHLGAALYTNPSQGGIVNQSNEPPPLSHCAAKWGDVLWLGNTVERPTLTIEPLATYHGGSNQFDLNGVHFSTKTGTFASGNATITAVSNVVGVKVGQYVVDSSYPVPNDGVTVQESDRTYVPQGTKVAAVRTIITLTSHANIDTATPDLIAFDSLSTITSAAADLHWDASISAWPQVLKGANLGEDADNLAASINGGDWALWGAGDLTAVSDNVDTVTITSDDGHGLAVTFTESTGGTYTVAYEIDMDANAKASGSGQSLDVLDYVEINGAEFYPTTNVLHPPQISHFEDTASLSGLLAWQALYLDLSATSNLDRCQALARNMGDNLNAQAIRGSAIDGRFYVDDVAPVRWFDTTAQSLEAGPSSLVMLGETAASAALTFNAPVRPASWRVSGSEQTSLSTDRPGRLFWSKPDQPESFPVLNYVDVGDSRAEILQLVALENALLVFKTDGIYSVTGSAPRSWVVDELDPSKRLIAAQCTAVLDNVCYAWTDRGVFQVTEHAIAPTPISAPISSTLREYQRLCPVGNADHKSAFRLHAHQRLGLIILSADTSTVTYESAEQFVWAKATGAWSKWTRTDMAAGYDPAEDRMLVAPHDSGWDAVYERDAEDAAASYRDVEGTGSSTSVVFGTPTRVITNNKTAFGVYTPAVGDVIKWVGIGDGGSDLYRKILSVTDNGSTYTFDLDGSGGAAAFTWIQGIVATLLWQAQHLAGMGQRWQEIHAELLATETAYLDTMAVALGGATHLDTSPASVEATVTPPVTYSLPVRAGVPRECVRTPQMYPYLQICGAGYRWELSHLYLHHTTTSRRVRR